MRFLRSLPMRAFTVYFLLFLVGLTALMLLFRFGPATYMVPVFVGGIGNSSVGQTLWRNVSFIQRGSLITLILLPVATILLTVSLFEIVKYTTEFLVGYWTERHKFDELFGDNASGRGDLGTIFLEPTDMPRLLELVSPGITKDIGKPEKNRFFKARHWINRWDTEGAKAIREMFQKRGYPPPQLSHSTQDIDVGIPFAFSMGLGFTEETDRIVAEACENWLRISKSESGDWIELRQQLLPDSVTLFKATDRSKGREFREIMPNNWDLTNWNANPGKVRDYAMILRHTRKHVNSRQVIFVLGGFTEYGTAAAATYVVDHWRELWKDHVRGRVHTPGMGDFMLLIEGPSGPDDLSKWRSDPNLSPVTPEMLREPYHIDCEWSRRASQAAQTSTKAGV